ncbi:MAG TPA: class IV adenylate cyclase [Patescibacteria group bacterium]
MTEIELKYEVNGVTIKRVLKKANDMDLNMGKRLYEKTVMFDNPSGLMQITDGRVRLRQTGDEVEFSYKKPITRNGIKEEIEYETKVGDFKIIEKILNKMEFKAVSSYERYRTTIKNSSVKITIDEFPFTSFIEIEGTRQNILEMSKKLGLEKMTNITQSCDSLFQEWRKKRGLAYKPHMRFYDFNK